MQKPEFHLLAGYHIKSGFRIKTEIHFLSYFKFIFACHDDLQADRCSLHSFSSVKIVDNMSVWSDIPSSIIHSRPWPTNSTNLSILNESALFHKICVLTISFSPFVLLKAQKRPKKITNSSFWVFLNEPFLVRLSQLATA